MNLMKSSKEVSSASLDETNEAQTWTLRDKVETGMKLFQFKFLLSKGTVSSTDLKNYQDCLVHTGLYFLQKFR